MNFVSLILISKAQAIMQYVCPRSKKRSKQAGEQVVDMANHGSRGNYHLVVVLLRQRKMEKM